MNAQEYIARQLNDHEDSPRGIAQPTYFEWSKAHIDKAVENALCYLYSLFPSRFSEPQTLTIDEPSCKVSFCESCYKFMGIIDLTVNGQGCVNANEDSGNSNSMSSLLSTYCVRGDKETDDYSYTVVNGSTCLVKFDRPLPKGTVVNFLCAKKPNLDELDEGILCEYNEVISNHALWWLYRSNKESRDDMVRASAHFEGLKDFVQTKLLLEFSLREDDYDYGRRRVDD